MAIDNDIFDLYELVLPNGSHDMQNGIQVEKSDESIVVIEDSMFEGSYAVRVSYEQAHEDMIDLSPV